MTDAIKADTGPTPGIRQRQKAARPGQIIEAAFAEFAEKGYAATRLEDVARRIGVTKGTIYFYFPSKEELFKAMVRAHLVPLMEGVELVTAASTQTSGEALLRTLIDTTYADLVANPKSGEFMRLMIGEASRVRELAQFYQREITDRGARAILGVIQRGVTTGEFHADAAAPGRFSIDAIMGPAVIAALHRVTLANIGAPLPDVEMQKATHLDMLLNGLRPRR